MGTNKWKATENVIIGDDVLQQAANARFGGEIIHQNMSWKNCIQNIKKYVYN